MTSPRVGQTFWKRFAKEPLLLTPFFWPWRAFFAFDLDAGDGSHEIPNSQPRLVRTQLSES